MTRAPDPGVHATRCGRSDDRRGSGRTLAVAVEDGQVYAFDDACAHAQCPLSGGEVEDDPQPAATDPSSWSDQYDRNLQYVGSHDADCDVVGGGDLSQPTHRCSSFFLRAGGLAAVLSVDSGRDLRRAKRLIRHAVDPTALADLRQLAPLAAAAS